MRSRPAALLILIVCVGSSICACLPGLPAASAAARENVKSDDPGMPQYKPRKESTPRARLDGDLRGSDAQNPVVVALVPDHVGLTLKAQPSLCWYLSQKTSLPITFTLLDPRVIRPILEATIPASTHPGVQCLFLKEYGLTLDRGQQYRWAIVLAIDPEQPSRDVVSGGMIERMPFEEGCTMGLPCAGACTEESVNRSAEAGLWYDAISCLCKLIEAAPTDLNLRKRRAALLRQIDIHDVAEYDLRQGGTR